MDRLYEYEEFYAMIPKTQTDVKMMSKPEFIQYFDDYESSHVNKLDKLYLKVLQLIQEVRESAEVEVVKRDELIGHLILFDKMANEEVLIRKEQIIKILLMVYTGSSLKDEKITSHIWNICIRTIASAERWKKFKPHFVLEDSDLYYTSHTFAKINNLKTELSREVEDCKSELRKYKSDQLIIARGIVDSILSFSGDLENKNLVQQDVRIIGSIEIWICYFDEDEEYLLKITNYLIERFFKFHSSVRNKALSVCRKIVELRLRQNNFVKEEGKVEPADFDEPKDFNRFLPEGPKPYLDHLELGWNTSLASYKTVKPEAPFSKCSAEIQRQDKLFAELIDDNQTFIRNLFSTVLLELNSKEDLHTIQEGGSQMNRYKNIIMKLLMHKGDAKGGHGMADKLGKLAETVSSVRYFNVFYQIFKYYGIDIYKMDILPVIKEYVEKGFKDIEHPHV